MLLFETIDRVNRIHQLIRLEATGSPDEFAGKLNLKKRQLYNILEEFKDYGADVRYSRIKNSYYYNNNFDVMVEISISPLSKNEELSFNGGNFGLIIRSDFFFEKNTSVQF
jgi:hypothetical protein